MAYAIGLCAKDKDALAQERERAGRLADARAEQQAILALPLGADGVVQRDAPPVPNHRRPQRHLELRFRVNLALLGGYGGHLRLSVEEGRGPPVG